MSGSTLAAGLAVAAGLAGSIQVAIMSRLGERIGVLEALAFSTASGGLRVTILEPSPATGMFDPIGMLNAHPGKSKKFLLEGYRDTDRALRGREPRTGRVKGASP